MTDHCIKKVVRISTTYGETYCEVYEPSEAGVGNQSNPVLMIHGCGGCVDHWTRSNLPVLLANAGKTVICFDFYSHGASVQLNSKEVQHNLALFLTQLNDVIHSPELPILGSESFTAHGFSMGCYVLLQYCVKYKPFKQNTVSGSDSPKPYINKIIFQSPWDGHVPRFLRGLMHIPLLLRICKPWDMADIKSVKALKQILLSLDDQVNYKESVTVFAEAVTGSCGDTNLTISERNPIASPEQGAVMDKSTSECDEGERVAEPESTRQTETTQQVSAEQIHMETKLSSALQQEGICCPVLVITGTRELPFELTGRRLARYVHRTYAQRQQHQHHQQQQQQAHQSLVGTSVGLCADASTDSSNPTESASTPPSATTTTTTATTPKSHHCTTNTSTTTQKTPTCRSKKEKKGYLQGGPHVQFRICKYAGHMSFVKHKPGSYVKTFFQREIVNFVVGQSNDTGSQ